MKLQELTVLIIDDDTGDRDLIKRYLSSIAGWRITSLEAYSLKTAVPIMIENGIDIIFLDYILGAESGLDVLDSLQKSGKYPVVALTGQGDERIAAEFLRRGGADYIVKNDLTPIILRRAIEHALHKHEEVVSSREPLPYFIGHETKIKKVDMALQRLNDKRGEVSRTFERLFLNLEETPSKL